MTATANARTTWFLLARRPGWRNLPALTDLADVDGSFQLASIAPPPAPPTDTCVVSGCDELAVVDRTNRRLLFTTADGQIRSVVGPIALDDATPPGAVRAAPSRRLSPTDVMPVLVWPDRTWEPTAVTSGACGHVWVVDANNDRVHEINRRTGWVRSLEGLLVPSPAADRAVAPFAASGRAVIGPLDSGIDSCVWDRIVLRGATPPGSRLDIRTTTSDGLYSDAEVALVDEGAWARVATCTGKGHESWDALVHSRPGRWLWLELRLSGDGVVTPRVDDVEVHFPRDTSAKYLPPAYRTGPDGGAFIDEFLSISDSIRRSVTTHLDDTPLLLDADSTPADPTRDFLSWLSGWLGVDDAEMLPEERRRQLLQAAPALYRHRGTPDGVQRHTALWLGRNVHLLEHYHLRRWAVVHRGRLGDTSRLFGPDIVRRLQLDEFSAVGAVRLIDVPDPLRDPFHFYAHRFTLIVRATRSDDCDELADRAAHITSVVAPAHSLAEICVVRPELRVGVQATIGIDALVGAAPDPEPLGDGHLGSAFVLGGDPTRTGPRVGQTTRVARTAVG